MPSLFIYLDASDTETEGTFRWAATGAVMTYDNWHPEEPNDSESGEDCAVLDKSDGHWNDVDCEGHFNSVCEIEY